MHDPTMTDYSHPRPTRFYSRTVEHTLWEMIVRFCKYGTWERRRCVFDPVYEGDPRYERAPFEEKFFWNPLRFTNIQWVGYADEK